MVHYGAELGIFLAPLCSRRGWSIAIKLGAYIRMVVQIFGLIDQSQLEREVADCSREECRVTAGRPYHNYDVSIDVTMYRVPQLSPQLVSRITPASFRIL
ncbi:MAG: hypothetical protein GY820_44630 [Gammaproteobacteria bacterium]|nr:hypothetical protein [Gammaproteobacteria bacterium]